MNAIWIDFFWFTQQIKINLFGIYYTFSSVQSVAMHLRL